MALSEYTPAGEVRTRPVHIRNAETAPTGTASSAFLRAQQARERLSGTANMGSTSLGSAVNPETAGAMARFLQNHLAQPEPEAVVTDIPADDTQYNEQCPPGMDIIDQGVEKYVEAVKQSQPRETTEKQRKWPPMEIKSPEMENAGIDTLDQEGRFNSVSTPKVSEKTPKKDEVDVDSVDKEDETPEFTDEELLPILDAILCKGYAFEAFKLRNINVALKSRFSWEELRALKAAEAQGFVMAMGGNLALTYSLLAGALLQYGQDVFQPINEGTEEELDANYKERFEFIRGLPAVVNDILINREAKFNRKLAAVVKDFDRLIQAF